MSKEIKPFESVQDLKTVLATQYMKQINNYFGDDKKALAFMSAVVSATQRIPALIECTPVSVINSFMTMAQLGFMPSSVSGEAYVLPYNNSKKVGNEWVTVKEAQFQLGYQGLVTLFYRSGVKQIAAEIVFANDKFEYVNGQVHHTPDVFSEDRGKPVGAYVVVTLPGGGVVNKVMSAKEILDIAKKFSKSFGGKHSPWDEESDTQRWMWKKTVLKQVAKLVPKNEMIVSAIAEDNKDSIIGDRLEAAKKDTAGLSMGAHLLDHGKTEDEKNAAAQAKSGEESQDGITDAEGAQTEGAEGPTIEG
jgi:recombination protein RecT